LKNPAVDAIQNSNYNSVKKPIVGSRKRSRL
jgi:hypothetical protein